MPTKNSNRINMGKGANKKAFVTITNQQIYDEIKAHNCKMDDCLETLDNRVIKLESKTGWHNKLIMGAYGFTMFVLGIVVNHLL